jgi:hypothetical protein
MRRFASILILLLAVSSAIAYGQGRNDRNAGNTRAVEGVVTGQDGTLVEGAVVQLKDTKSLQIRSFITREGGSYHFHGLSRDIDYELKADHQGKSSDTRTLSSFDSRRKAVINLKLEK